MNRLLLFLPLLAFCSAGAQDGRRTLTEYETFEPGVPVVLVVSLAKNDEKPEPFFAEREVAELQENFPDYDIRLIDKHGVYRFDNDAKDIANFSDSEKAYELVVFWNGDADAKIRTELIKTKLTEFISSVTGQKKTSGYLAENQKIFDEIARRKTANKPDKNAKDLTQYYIRQMLFNPMVYGDVEFYGLTHQDYGMVKSVTVFAKAGDNPEKKTFTLVFNNQHLVSHIGYEAIEKGTVTFDFTYDANGLLKKMVNNDSSQGKAEITEYAYSYQPGRIVETSKDQFTEYALENNMLLTTSHYEYIDYDENFRIESVKEIFEDGCLARYEDGEKKRAYCPSGFDGNTPYTYVKQGFKYDQLARQATSKIEREGNTFVIYNLNPNNEQYYRAAAVTVNDKGLTETTEGGVQKGIKNMLLFKYEYF